jgi:UDP-GlcNAc:undecaprenyl-phosphate GlcNAc-1-phosphate transferase
MLWVALITNALNLLDGLDGLAAGAGAIAGFFLAMAGVLEGEADVRTLGLVLAGALLGFYPYNFPRARVFLGDVGSTFIGLVLATLALLQNRKTTVAMTLLLPIVALGLPMLDTLFAVVRRTASRRNPLQRDLGHLHHRLLRLGLSTRQAVAALLALSTVFGSVALLLAALPKQVALSVTVILGGASFAGLVGLVRLERQQRRSEPAARQLLPGDTVLRTDVR